MRKEEPMKTKNLRRGATLTELMVVIAVIAIVAVMVVSFSAMVSGGREMAQAKLDALQDIRLAESVIENFIEENNGNITFEKNENEENIKVKCGEESISFMGGYLVVIRDGNTSLITLETVDSVTFEKYEKGTDAIYYCTITYDIGGTNPERYTFCVNPYAGEKI